MDKVLYSEGDILASIMTQAERFNENAYRVDMQSVHVLGILNGGFMYASEFVKHIEIPVEVDFMKIVSYRGQTGEQPKIRYWPDISNAMHVLVLDDMLDRGDTIKHAVRYIQTINPRTISVCTMLHNGYNLEKNQEYFEYHSIWHHPGLMVSEWVYGYGLDDNKFHRNKPMIYAKSNL